jgi:hypothetical protein
MAFCGYNDTMADGIRMLVEGMIEAMVARHTRGEPMKEVVETELRDLRVMNSVILEQEPVPRILEGLAAINLFAQSIFSLSRDSSDDPDDFAKACRKQCERFIKLVQVTEQRHEAEMEATGRGDAAITAVAKFLLEKEKEPPRYFDSTNPQGYRRSL